MSRFIVDSVSIREAQPEDYTDLGRVMFESVRNGDSRYTEPQRAAWVSEPRRGPEWDERLARQFVLLAIQNDSCVGFMSLEDTGYVDFAYVLPDWRGKGIFRRLYAAIERESTRRGMPMLWVHASLNAESAFRAMGFEVTLRETVEIGAERLDRAKMEKHLKPTAP